MAATIRLPKHDLLQALRSSVYPGVGGSGSTCCRCPLGAKRYLLTDSIVKLEEFQHKKVAIAYHLPGTKATYLRNMEEKLTQNKLILKAELKTLLHLCDSRDDMELVKNVIYRYHAENRNVNFGAYKFGPLFMRVCYELDLEESAVELIKDQHLRGFFSDSTSFNILMDMLFIKGKYSSALEVLIEMKNQDVKFNKDTYVLAFAICYKLNSPESLKICNTLREEALIKGEVLSRRASCFAVALALNQNQVAKAISIFSQIMKQENILCTNLNILIHIQANMLKTLIEILKDAAEGSLSKFVRRQEFSEEVDFRYYLWVLWSLLSQRGKSRCKTSEKIGGNKDNQHTIATLTSISPDSVLKILR
ncbi:pentatricopeptide repeat-containing protein 2, mitochondrial isoform X2 [Lutra lutra]|uniref:pentatricopeptide repeat-containing protein 2, mitochondrial isoform X2 n=1 Tax=Lutra lutra TaxID=9657 RepID=UPI001FD09C1A|nr:pentatricopeptide repeat-containing protein 2, mitochondrial isoform X2 [Lutra lutra]XP_047587068.1 pentatricopeptide repeat-containing protein 2, mitochondrial isoform X2 [Lutra lutra]